MSARLVIRKADGTVQSFPLGEQATIGSGAGCEVTLSHADVSPMHARLTTDDEGYWIEDRQSNKGTFVNGERIDRARLRHFDVISIGNDVSMVFVATRPGSARVEVAAAAGPSTPTIAGKSPLAPGALPKFAATINEPLEALTPPPAPRGHVPAEVLRAQHEEKGPEQVTRPPVLPDSIIPPTVMQPRPDTQPITAVRLAGSTESFKTSLGTCVVGRYADAGIRINSKEISRRHAVLVIRSNEITVEDQKSANGTRVNGVRTTGITPLKHGDELAFSGFKFRVEVIRQ